MTKIKDEKRKEEGTKGEGEGGRERENKRMSLHKGHQVDAPS